MSFMDRLHIKIKLKIRTKSELFEWINNSDFQETAADIFSQVKKKETKNE